MGRPPDRGHSAIICLFNGDAGSCSLPAPNAPATPSKVPRALKASLAAGCGADSTERVGAAGQQAAAQSGWPDGLADIEARLSIRRAFWRTVAGKTYWVAEAAARKGRPLMAWPLSSVMAERTSEARTLAGLQFKLNPGGWGHPGPVSHLSGEATNPIAILLQRCLARIWPSFVGLIQKELK